MVTKWEKKLKDNMSDIFIRKNEQEPDTEGRINNLYKEIARMQVENTWL
ncbi:MAG: hypothetical protein ACI9F2_000974 [Lysobacterales bacterium]|jgi:hypothetical protein